MASNPREENSFTQLDFHSQDQVLQQSIDNNRYDNQDSMTSQSHMTKGLFKVETPNNHKGSILKMNKQDPNKREEACCQIF